MELAEGPASVPTVVATWLRDLISSGQLRDGDRLPSELALCRLLGVGRSSVREALRALETLGYVEIRPGRGRFLREDAAQSTGRQLVERLQRGPRGNTDLVDLRVAIESTAAGLAAVRHTTTEIEQIVRAEEEFERHVGVNDVDRIVSADEAFHDAVLVTSRNELLTLIGELMRKPLREHRRDTFGLPGYPQRSVAPHRAIIAAIRSRDVTAARAAVAAHIYSSNAEAAETAMALDDRMVVPEF